MMRDRSLTTLDSDSPEAWAPAIALSLLKPLDVSNVVPDLLALLDVDFDLFSDEITDLLSNAGIVALQPSLDYLLDRTRWMWGRGRTLDIIVAITKQHPEERERVITILGELLAESDNEYVLSCVVDGLLKLKAVEQLPQIRRAFELSTIDETITGPWGDALQALGLEPEPGDPLIELSQKRFQTKQDEQITPAMRRQHEALHHLRELQTSSKKRKQEQARKQKNKKKAASAARKANRKKRK